MKRPRGRPPKDPNEAKSQWLQIRIDQEEKARFFAAAETAGLPLSEWAREQLRKAAEKPPKGR
jgi:predicted HicB family RNase H-like nuclease